MQHFRSESVFYQRRLQYFFNRVVAIKPKKHQLYAQAFYHKSYAPIPEGLSDNERLEFLGDALYNAFCTEHLYFHYKNSPEGKLTQLKSQLASRSFLNKLAKELHLVGLIKHNLQSQTFLDSNVPGNCLEAFFGAVYLDLGAKRFKKWLEGIFDKYIDIEEVKVSEKDYKSLLWMYSQSVKKSIDMAEEEIVQANKKHHKITLGIEELGEVSAIGRSKKQAQQVASKLLLQKLGKL